MEAGHVLHRRQQCWWPAREMAYRRQAEQADEADDCGGDGVVFSEASEERDERHCLQCPAWSGRKHH